MNKKQERLFNKLITLRSQISSLERMAEAGFPQIPAGPVRPAHPAYYKPFPGCKKFVKLIISEILKLEKQMQALNKEIDKNGGFSMREKPFPRKKVSTALKAHYR